MLKQAWACAQRDVHKQRPAEAEAASSFTQTASSWLMLKQPLVWALTDALKLHF